MLLLWPIMDYESKLKTAFLEKQFFQKAHGFMIMMYDKKHITQGNTAMQHNFYKIRGVFQKHLWALKSKSS